MQNPSASAVPAVSAELTPLMLVAYQMTQTRQVANVRPIAGPDVHGRFPATRTSPAPVVVDANRIYQDLIYACRHTARTTQINAANQGAIRLFCEHHVLEECHRHIDNKWSLQADIPATVLRARFEAEYLPLLRVVNTPTGL